jgi:hypothetical protein
MSERHQLQSAFLSRMMVPSQVKWRLTRVCSPPSRCNRLSNAGVHVLHHGSELRIVDQPLMQLAVRFLEVVVVAAPPTWKRVMHITGQLRLKRGSVNRTAEGTDISTGSASFSPASGFAGADTVFCTRRSSYLNPASWRAWGKLLDCRMRDVCSEMTRLRGK